MKGSKAQRLKLRDQAPLGACCVHECVVGRCVVAVLVVVVVLGVVGVAVGVHVVLLLILALHQFHPPHAHGDQG